MLLFWKLRESDGICAGYGSRRKVNANVVPRGIWRSLDYVIKYHVYYLHVRLMVHSRDDDLNSWNNLQIVSKDNMRRQS